MIEQNVQVLRCESERFWVRMGTRSDCTACDNGKGCGAGLFAKLLQRKPVVLELARKDMQIQAGQMLTLAFPEQVYMKLVLTSYGWPLLAGLAGAYAGYVIGVSLQFGLVMIDVATLTGGILAAWFVLRFFKSRKVAEVFLNSLDTTICVPSNTPNMCNSTHKEPESH